MFNDFSGWVGGYLVVACDILQFNRTVYGVSLLWRSKPGVRIDSGPGDIT